MKYSPVRTVTPLPNAIGVEHEYGLNTWVGRYPIQDIDSYLGVYFQTSLKRDKLSMTNGGKTFFDTGKPFETSTPECLTPLQAVQYDEACKMLVVHGIQNILKKNEDISYVRFQNRVIDNYKHTLGVHDNYGVERRSPATFGQSIHPLLHMHLNTRGVVSGAGLIGSNNWQLSQKLGTVDDLCGKKYGSTMIYYPEYRIEVRSADANISNWAEWQRIGATALVIYLIQSQNIPEKLIRDFYPEVGSIGFKDGINVSENGKISYPESVLQAIKFQNKLASYILDKVVEVPDFPYEYFALAREWENYSKELEAVTTGELELYHLADSSDWAAKFSLILKALNRDQKFGIERTPFDDTAMAQDFRYDIQTITGDKVTQGYGYRIPGRPALLSSEDLKQAAISPPNTRAHDRVAVLKKFSDSHFSTWQSLTRTPEDKAIILDDNPAVKRGIEYYKATYRN